VTWTLGPPSQKGPVGSLSDPTNTSVIYNAPDVTAKEAQVTVTATAVSDPTQSAVIGIVIEPPPTVTTVSSDLPQSFVGTDFLGTINEVGGVPPYTWEVTPGSLPAGLSLSDDPNIVRMPGAIITTNSKFVYINGKPTTSELANFTIQVTDATGVVATAPLSLPVHPKLLKVQAPTIVDGRIGIAYPPTALVTNDGVPPYTWSLLSGTMPPGLSLSSDGVISGTPTGPEIGFEFTVQVTDAQAPVEALGMVNIAMIVRIPNEQCGAGGESLSDQAPYAFLLQGFDADGPVTIAGSFTADAAGHITGGVEDINRGSGVQTNLTIDPAGSSYSFGGGRGCLTLVNSEGVTTVFRFSMTNSGGSVPTAGRIIEFDDNSGTGTRASGILRLQDPSSFTDSAFSGLYAFGFRGWNAASGSFAMAGSANASGGILSSVAADINNGGTLSSGLIGGSGSYSVAANGRGTASFSAGTSTFNVALYMLDHTHAMFLTTDALSAAHPLASGEAVLTSGPFDVDSLKDNHIFHSAGISAAGPDVALGILGFDGNGKFAGTLFENNAGTMVLDPDTGRIAMVVSGDYSVDANTGRVTFSGADAGTHPPVLYIVPATTGVTGLLVGTDASASSGRLVYQVANPPQFDATSVFGDYIFGTDGPADSLVSNLEGLVSANGTGGFFGVQDASPPAADSLFPNQGLTGTYSVLLDGSGTFGGNTVSVTNGSVVFYMDQSPINLHPAIMVLEK